jgi:hypothetical protein
MTKAQMVGRNMGNLAIQVIKINKMIDWEYVLETFIEGLKVTIVLLFLAGQYTRKAWDSLPEWSESLGEWWAAIITDGDLMAYFNPHNGTIPYKIAIKLVKKQEVYNQFVEIYGPEANWNCPEWGNLGIDLGDLNMFIYEHAE